MPAVLSYRWSMDLAVLNTSETTVVGDGYLSEGWQRRRVGRVVCSKFAVLVLCMWEMVLVLVLPAP